VIQKGYKRKTHLEYMDYKRELKLLKGFAGKILSKSTLRKIKPINDLEWKIESLKYAIRYSLEKEYNDLYKRLKKMEFEKKEVFFVSTKLSTLRSKIRLFDVTFHKQDFENILKLLKEIKEELKKY